MRFILTFDIGYSYAQVRFSDAFYFWLCPPIVLLINSKSQNIDILAGNFALCIIKAMQN